MILKAILTAICLLSSVHSYYHSQWINEAFDCGHEECRLERKKARQSVFNRIVGLSVVSCMALWLFASTVPLAFYTGIMVHSFYEQRIARKVLA